MNTSTPVSNEKNKKNYKNHIEMKKRNETLDVREKF